MNLGENREPVVPASDTERFLAVHGLTQTAAGFVYAVNGNPREPELVGAIDHETGDFVPNDPFGCQEDTRDALDDYLGEA